MKTYAYVDGFNLYFGSVKDTPYRWLDIRALLRLIFPRCQFDGIKYFTAKVQPRPDDPHQPTRQQTYLRALATIPNLTVYYGHFLTHEKTMAVVHPPPPFIKVYKTDEKGSDVNLAAQLLHDAHLKRFEQAIVVSGDSDLLMPIRLVIDDLHVPVGVLNPQHRRCAVLEQHATFYKHIRRTALERSQFPATMTDAQGTFTKPSSW